VKVGYAVGVGVDVGVVVGAGVGDIGSDGAGVLSSGAGTTTVIDIPNPVT